MVQKVLSNVSLVTTVYNECDKHLGDVLAALAEGTALPAEFIIADGGSTDGTVGLLKSYQLQYPELNIVILELGRSNIAKGRNEAIAHARFGVIAVTDAGCKVKNDWLEKITHPILSGKSNHVAGWYEPLCRNEFQEKLAPHLFPALSSIDKNNFLPSSRSIAFTKEVFASVGGYPEWMTFAGEDTFFDIEIVKKWGSFEFASDAVVYWEPVADLSELKKKYYMYGLGEGEGLMYKKKALIRAVMCLIPLDLILSYSKRKVFLELYTIRKCVTLGYLNGFVAKIFKR